MALEVGEAVVKLKFDGTELKSSATQREIEASGEKTGGFWGNAFSVAAGQLISKGISTLMGSLKNLGQSVLQIGMDFESQMSKVSAISGATGEDLDALTAKAKEMGASTKFTATESGQALEYMAMAGWKTSDMLDGLEGIMSLAAAAGEDLGTTSDIVTDALTAFGLTAADSTHFADVLAVASSNANTNVSMMGETFKYVAPVAGALNYSVEDTAKAIGLLANSGIKASQAGTTLRSIMSRMASPTDGVRAAMDELGLSLTNADGTMKSFNEVMGDIQRGMAGLSEVEQAAAASAIAGKNAMSGFLAIANAAPSDIEKLDAALAGADGTAKNMAKTMNDNLKGSLTILRSEWEATQLALYDADLAGFFSNLDQTLGHLGDIVIQAAPTFLEGANGVIQAIAVNLPYWLAEMAPVVVEGIVGLINSLVLSLPDFVQGIINLVLAIVQALVPQLPTLLSNIITAVIGVVKTLTSPENLKAVRNTAYDLLITLTLAVPDIIVALADALPSIIENIIQFLTDPATIGRIIEAAVILFFGLVLAVPQILGSLIQAFGQLVGSLWNGIKNLFGDFAGQFGSFIGNVFKGAINGVIGFIEHFVNFPINILNGFIDTINWAFGWIGVNLSRVKTVSLPRLAEGGAANSATAAIFGEAGTEVVLPLEQNQDNWAGLLASTLAEEMREQGEGTGSPITVYMTNEINSGLDIQTVSQGLMEEIRRAA